MSEPKRLDYLDGWRVVAIALVLADHEARRAEQAERRRRGARVQLGIGISTYVETTNPMGSGEFGAVEITADGGAIVRTGSSPHGQGHHTSWAMIVSDLTGIPMDRIEFRFGDTEDVARGGGTGGSRSLQVGGSAVKLAAEAVIEKAKQLAADLLEAAPEDIVLDTARGQFHVTGSPQPARSWSDLAVTGDVTLAADVDYVPEPDFLRVCMRVAGEWVITVVPAPAHAYTLVAGLAQALLGPGPAGSPAGQMQQAGAAGRGRWPSLQRRGQGGGMAVGQFLGQRWEGFEGEQLLHGYLEHPRQFQCQFHTGAVVAPLEEAYGLRIDIDQCGQLLAGEA